MTVRTSDNPAAPVGRTLVYLARHGRTPLNESDALRGLADPPLDDLGQRQARELGALLGVRKPSIVVASPLLRARQTAWPVARRAVLDVVTDQRLVDRDYGPWTGVRREQVIAEWGSVDDAPGVEAKAAVRARAVAGLTDIAQRHRGGTVVAVSHDAVNRQVLVAFDPGLGDAEALPQDNGCFNTLELRDGGWAVLTVNDIPGRTEHEMGPDDHRTNRLRDALADVDFPAGKDELIRAAQAADTSDSLIKALRAIPPVQYANRSEVERSVPADPAAGAGLSPAQRAEQAREQRHHGGQHLSQHMRDVPKPAVEQAEEELDR